MAWKLAIKEMLHYRFNLVSTLMALIIAVGLFVSFYTLNIASDRETKRLTRDMGFNLRIIPGETDINRFWIEGYADKTMPQEYIGRFMEYSDFAFAHLTATLHHRMNWQGDDILLTGISQEYEPSGKDKSPMIFSIPGGEAYVGYEIARQNDIRSGDSIALAGKNYHVTHVNAETGSIDDIRLFVNLEEAQEIAGKKGEINEIMALNCLCVTSDTAQAIQVIRSQLEEVLPEAKVIMNMTIAEAREKQRIMVEKYGSYLLLLILLSTGLWIGILAMNNVKARRHEIGILKALGYPSGTVAGVFLIKYLLIALAGAVFGFLAGTWLSLETGSEIFRVTADGISPVYSLLLWALLLTPAFMAISTFIPFITAINQEPFKTLREE